MRARRNSIILRLAWCSLVSWNLLLKATCQVSRASSCGGGRGSDRNPALCSCQTYWFLPLQVFASPLAMDRLSRQASGLGPALLLPFTTYSMRPSLLTLTALGYQPVGSRPITWLLPGRPSSTTATAFRPPLVTNNVRSSGDSARALGLAPRSFCRRGNTDFGAETLNASSTLSLSVSMTATVSLLSTAANRRRPGAIEDHLVGLPGDLDPALDARGRRRPGPAPRSPGHAGWTRRPCRRPSTPPRTGIRRRARRPCPGRSCPDAGPARPAWCGW